MSTLRDEGSEETGMLFLGSLLSPIETERKWRFPVYRGEPCWECGTRKWHLGWVRWSAPKEKPWGRLVARDKLKLSDGTVYEIPRIHLSNSEWGLH